MVMYKRFVRFKGSLSKMVRVLNVAEKNDAAKSIADVMSRGTYRKREGYSRFNKIYEFDLQIFNRQCTMTMTSVSGHLLAMEFGAGYRKWNSCSPAVLFDVPITKSCPEDFVDIKRTLEREVRGCSHLVIWTDCDREGENIGFEVIQVCREIKPNIEVFRARFSEITPGAITRAVNNLQRPDKRVSDAVDVRTELDLRIGAAFTRFQTMRLQKVFPEYLTQQLVSYGSCQFPTLGFVVERYKQVQAFIPEPFWKLKVIHTLDDIKAEFSWKRNRLFNHLACRVLYEHCIESPIATVHEVKSKSKSKWRPQALDTVELEKIASRKLHINAKETMKIAEKLYTKGFISYPRTETNVFPKDFNLPDLVQEQSRDPNWGDFAAGLLEEGPNPRNGNKTDNAHPPIHPLKYTATLQGNEQRVYEYIVRHFLACCSKDAQGMETTVDVDIAGEQFVSSGLMIIAKNYLEVYPYEKWNAKEIPVYKEADQFEPNSIEMICSETTAPPLLSEADLIALMEKHGIGTDATHAEHIETIKNRSYVGVKPDGRFVPGQLGMGLVEGYDEMGQQMSKPHLRAELEADLKRICEGKKDRDVVLREQVEKYKAIFILACEQAVKLDEALAQYFGQAQVLTAADVTGFSGPSIVRKCPICGQDMTLRKKKDGKGYYIGCMGYPQCRTAVWLPDFVLEAEVTEEVCPECRPAPVQLLKFKFRRGSTPPSIPSEFTGCVGGCDSMLKNVLNIPTFVPRNNSTPSTTQSPVEARQSLAGNYFANNSSSQENQHPPQSRNKNNSRTSSTIASNQGSGGGSTFFASSQGRRDSHLPLAAVPPANRKTTPTSKGDSSAIVCNCGSDAMLLTVRKEGPNTGRTFYKCNKPSGQGCNFFLWADENNNEANSSDNDHSRQSNSRPPAPTNYNKSWGQSSQGDSGRVICKCNQDGKLLTVQKEGPNQGREFYVCPKPRDQGCEFFQWADESANQSNRDSNKTDPSRSSNSRPPTTANLNNTWGQSSQGDSDRVMCKCNQDARSLTVNKEGPNKGRPFYGCPKPREQGCGFFQWGDEQAAGGEGGGYGGGGRGYGGGDNRDGGGGYGGGVSKGGGKKRFASGEAKGPSGKKRKCGLCGVEGHTKRTCPHKGPS